MILSLFGFAWLRLHLVGKFFHFYTERVYELTKDDIAQGRHQDKESPFWRWQEYEKVSFDAVVFKFWRPLKAEAFWDDTSFLEE